MTLETFRFEGMAWRAHDPRWSFKPISGQGAAVHGGRFNPKGTPTLYLSLDPMTAIREASQGFAHKFEPCILCTYEVDNEDIVDLATEAGRQGASGEAADLAGKNLLAWRALWPATPLAVRKLRCVPGAATYYFLGARD